MQNIFCFRSSTVYLPESTKETNKKIEWKNMIIVFLKKSTKPQIWKFFNQQMGTYSIKLWVPVYFTIQSLLAKKTRLLCTKQKAGKQQAGYRALHCRSFRKHINFIINDKLFGKIATPQSSFSVNSLPQSVVFSTKRHNSP